MEEVDSSHNGSGTIIAIDGLQRTFRTRTGIVEAVSGVDMNVRPGEIVGLLGPNGAGKTTTMRMLTTLLQPTGGQARVAGEDLRANPRGVRDRVGYVAQAGGVDQACTVQEELLLQARLHGISKHSAQELIAELVGRFELEALTGRKTGELSGGQRRRLEIALGLVHNPPVVFLDEPTTGLDPQSRSNVWHHVQELRRAYGTTIFLTTHYMEEADVLCDRVFIIDHGVIVTEGTPTDLKGKMGGDVVTIEVPEEVERAEAILTERQQESWSVKTVECAGDTVRVVTSNGERLMAELLQVLSENGLHPRQVKVSHPTLEDVFLDITGRSLRDGTPSTNPSTTPTV